jgi:hypothetical protein
MTPNRPSLTLEQQLELEKIKREIQKISDLALLRSEYLSIDFAIRVPIPEETNEDTNQNSN